MDFGEEEEFFVLNAECFDTRVDKYKYEFCFFKNSKYFFFFFFFFSVVFSFFLTFSF